FTVTTVHRAFACANRRNLRSGDHLVEVQTLPHFSLLHGLTTSRYREGAAFPPSPRGWGITPHVTRSVVKELFTSLLAILELCAHFGETDRTNGPMSSFQLEQALRDGDRGRQAAYPIMDGLLPLAFGSPSTADLKDLFQPRPVGVALEFRRDANASELQTSMCLVFGLSVLFRTLVDLSAC